MSVAAVPYVVKIPYGVFNLTGREIRGITEKPTYSYYANAGIYLIKKERLSLIPKDDFLMPPISWKTYCYQSQSYPLSYIGLLDRHRAT